MVDDGYGRFVVAVAGEEAVGEDGGGGGFDVVWGDEGAVVDEGGGLGYALEGDAAARADADDGVWVGAAGGDEADDVLFEGANDVGGAGGRL